MSRYDDNFDPGALAQKAIESNLDVTIFNKINDRDVPKAANWFDWCVGTKFLNMDPRPFPRQIQMAMILFGEHCPRCSKPKYIDDLFDQRISDIRENVMFLEHGKCPKCKVTQNELWASKELMPFNEFNLVAGRRSSKTTFTSMVATYQMHRFLSLPTPSKYFRLLENQMLHMIMVAVSAEQAEDTLWQGFKDRIDSSVWFKNYHQFLTDEAKRLGIEPVFAYKQTMLVYTHKRLCAYFMGTNIRTLRGRTAFCTMVDEIGWFDQEENSGKILANAKETHEALSKSLKTVRAKSAQLRLTSSDVPDALDMNLSSPYSANDQIMQLVRASTPEKRSIGFHYATWQCVDKNTIVGTDQGLSYVSDAINSKSLISNGDEIVNPLLTHVSDAKEKITKITTKHHYNLAGPHDHRVKVLLPDLEYGFKEIGKLTNDDWVVIDYNPKDFGTVVDLDNSDSRFPTKLTYELATILGYLVAEGSYTPDMKNEMVFYNTSKEVVDDFENMVHKCFPSEDDTTTYAYRQSAPYNNITYKFKFHDNKQTRDFFTNIGMTHAAALVKKIPKVIWSAPKHMIAGFISGMFEGDGWSGKNKIRPGTNSLEQTELGYCTTSYQLAHELRILLLQFGIPTYTGVQLPKHPKHNISYSVRISGVYSLKQFQESIGFRSKIKNAKLFKNINRAGTRRSVSFYQKLPSFVTKEFLDIYNCIKLCNIQLERTFGRGSTRVIAVIRHSHKKGHYLSKIRLQDLLKSLKIIGLPDTLSTRIARLDKLVNSNYTFEKVVKIDGLPDDYVYDFQMPVKHQYWSNGFISHNCNPDISYEECLIDAEDRKTFDREYAAIPPLGHDPFLSDEILVSQCAKATQIPVIRYTNANYTDPVNPNVSAVYTVVSPKFKDAGQPRILSIDTGLSNNSFAITMLSYEASSHTVHLDAAVECVPQKHNGWAVPIHFPSMYKESIVPLLKNFNIIMVVYDHWNSIEAIQRIRQDFRIPAEQYTLKWDTDWQPLRSAIYDGKLIVPQPETPINTLLKQAGQLEDVLFSNPYTHLMYQMLTVREIGKKVVKPVNGTDDIFRAMALGVTKILDPSLTKKFVYIGGSTRRRNTGPSVGAIKSHNSGPSTPRAMQIGQGGSLIGVRSKFRHGPGGGRGLSS